jgi:hypothetical protein
LGGKSHDFEDPEKSTLGEMILLVLRVFAAGIAC